jgi:hypothetical protein
LKAGATIPRQLLSAFETWGTLRFRKNLADLCFQILTSKEFARISKQSTYPYVFETKSKNLLQARLDQEATPGYGCMPAGHEL